ncbi:MAG: GNAT family N-acetyltransferase [Desulfovibrio sp.]|uniref:GNAT family N-acetyltransferase n=1 Tax=Desulfovibrio sp. TaxID=885 RepID=UPI00135E74BD|nr:GNAT family N-acetyltransferase [Desulfovibrio sp.]MTJ91382.1 GNAT family N-acetyltransferase [Desulfovibrio sp.]
MNESTDTQAVVGLARPLTIRLATGADHHALTLLWRRSVEATHHFLPPAEVERLFEDVRRLYLPGVETLWVAELHQAPPAGVCPVGFMGCNGPQVEMLFVDPASFRCGVGTALLAHAKAAHQQLALDVNEQNPQALAFYKRQAFRIVGRSAQDGQGMPYPLLHLVWQRSEK